MNPQATQHDDQDAGLTPAQKSDVQLAKGQDASLPGKFLYASGSKPLGGYTIKRGIGRGGFGEVYYAISDGGKEVALKLLRRSFDVELRGVAHCLNLNHPHLLGLHDVRTDDQGDHWVVMEYVTGACLEEVIADYPDGMPLKEVTAWMHGIAAGVAYLHGCGVVHRDLKPGNIFSEQGLVKIGDYGLSKFISCSRRSGQTESVGTVHYMAPEIANGRYGKEIDVYAMGVMLYEMLTGKLPFEGESVGEVLMKHLTAEPDLSKLEEPYRSIVALSLAKDPDKRYGTADELVSALPAVDPKSSRLHVQPRVAPRPVATSDVKQQAKDLASSVFEGVKKATSNIKSAAEETDEPVEPIAHWLGQTAGRLSGAWRNDMEIGTKVIAVFAGIWTAYFLAIPLLPIVSFLTLMYLVYFALWATATWLFSPSLTAKTTEVMPSGDRAAAESAATPEPPTAVTSNRPKPKKNRRLLWHGKPQPALPLKSPRERITELLGSMVLGATACLVLSLVMLLLRGGQVALEDQFSQFAWLSLVSIAGTWGVLLPGKLWEGKTGEPALRRFWMLVTGLVIGAVAYGLHHDLLLVDLPNDFGTEYKQVAAGPISGSPTLVAYLGYLGFLFLCLRWWKLADPLRSTRLSLWTTLICVSWSGALYMLWGFLQTGGIFPQPWGFMLAAVIAISVQLASPWINPRKQPAMQEG